MFRGILKMQTNAGPTRTPSINTNAKKKYSIIYCTYITTTAVTVAIRLNVMGFLRHFQNLNILK